MQALPQFNKKKEANFGLAFRKWIEDIRPTNSSYELKQTETDSISFSAVKDKQISWLLMLSSDTGALVRVQGMSGEPDYIWGRKMDCYVFIKYPQGFVGIEVRDFVQEKKNSLRKSLTWDRAKEISTIKKSTH